jgi:hypothetical protein
MTLLIAIATDYVTTYDLTYDSLFQANNSLNAVVAGIEKRIRGDLLSMDTYGTNSVPSMPSLSAIMHVRDGML